MMNKQKIHYSILLVNYEVTPFIVVTTPSEINYFEIVLFQHITNLHGNIAFSFHIRVHTYLKPRHFGLFGTDIYHVLKTKLSISL